MACCAQSWPSLHQNNGHLVKEPISAQVIQNSQGYTGSWEIQDKIKIERFVCDNPVRTLLVIISIPTQDYSHYVMFFRLIV